MTTKLYRVTWEIDLEADSPEQAAQKARTIQQDSRPENIAHVYRVQERPIMTDSAPAVDVDLDDLEGKV